MSWGQTEFIDSSITKLRLDPRSENVQYVDQYAILINNHEAEGLTILDDGTVYVRAASAGHGEVFRVGRVQDFVSTFKDFTVSLWLKQNAIGNSPYPTLIAKGSSANHLNAFVLHTMNFESGTLRVKYGMTAPSWSGIVSKPVRADEWHHAVGINDHANGYSFYLDGHLVGNRPHTVRHTIVDHEVPMTIGADIKSNQRTHFFPGQIDEIQIVNSAASPALVAAMYQNIANYESMVQIGAEQNSTVP